MTDRFRNFLKAYPDSHAARQFFFVGLQRRTRKRFGTTGLIDTPTARMKSDGSLAAAYDQRYKQTALTYQALPWLEMTYILALRMSFVGTEITR